MQQIYEQKLWGDNNSQFYSGEGSHKLELVTPYISTVRKFLNSFTKPITVCDLGCGDFNIGKQLVDFTKRYYAIDIVPQLIDYNRENFKKPNLQFLCLDIAKENLPKADCVILRQVLQHLSNAEILKIVGKLKQYQFLILTEHLPLGEFVPNKDIISGQGIRLKKQSGVNLLATPFHLQVKRQQEILKIGLDNNKCCIQTSLYQL